MAVTNIENRLNREISSLLKHSRVRNFYLEVNKKITYNEFLSDKMLMIMAVRRGIPYSLFDTIKDYTPFSENDWAKFLDISVKSLQRYKIAAEHSFKPSHSETIIEMAEVTKVGLDVFGNMEKLKLWLNTPNYALGNLKPIELLSDSYGKEMVIDALTRINHGILV